jgi:hypothetical protein
VSQFCILKALAGRWKAVQDDITAAKAPYKALFVYTFVFFKVWEIYVLKNFAPNLLYNNVCLLEIPGMTHMGLYVNGISANMIQVVGLEFALLAVMGGRPADFAFAGVAGIAVAKLCCSALNVVMGQNGKNRCLVDRALSLWKGPRGHSLETMMRRHDVLALATDELRAVASFMESQGMSWLDVSASATYVREIHLLDQHATLDLLDGTLRAWL